MFWPTSQRVYSKRWQERNQENRSVEPLSVSVGEGFWWIYILFRPWSSSSIVKSEPVVYRSPSLTTICWSRSSICLAITPWRTLRVFDVCSHVKTTFVCRSPVMKIFRKWLSSLRSMGHRNWTFYWHERKVRHHRVAKWSERITNKRRYPMELNRITPMTHVSILLLPERLPHKNDEQWRWQSRNRRTPKTEGCSYPKSYVE